MITQELSIFYIELITIEHPKTDTKLSRSIKNPKIITQEQK